VAWLDGVAGNKDNEEVNYDKNGEADEMNLEVDSKVERQCTSKLEVHSVERMYLRRRCYDGSRWIQEAQLVLGIANRPLVHE